MAEAIGEKLSMEARLIDQKLTKNELEVEITINEIRKCDTSESELTELRSRARRLLQGISLDIQALVQLKEQEDTMIRQESLEDLAKNHKKVMMSLQLNVRKASLFASEKLSTLGRDNLLSKQKDGTAINPVVQRKKGENKAAAVASNITSNLVKIAEMMNSQVEHSIESTRVLEDSSKQLQETQEELKGMAGVIQMSKKLINKYSRRELTDTLLIFFGMVLFFSTVIYIILKRI